MTAKAGCRGGQGCQVPVCLPAGGGGWFMAALLVTWPLSWGGGPWGMGCLGPPSISAASDTQPATGTLELVRFCHQGGMSAWRQWAAFLGKEEGRKLALPTPGCTLALCWPQGTPSARMPPFTSPRAPGCKQQKTLLMWAGSWGANVENSQEPWPRPHPRNRPTATQDTSCTHSSRECRAAHQLLSPPLVTWGEPWPPWRGTRIGPGQARPLHAS